jgi:hypothetical protein
MSAQEFSLVIVETPNDAVLVLKPYCKKCATNKLSAIKYCSISLQDAKELIKNYNIKACKINCEC